jgi:hypothetical protein
MYSNLIRKCWLSGSRSIESRSMQKKLRIKLLKKLKKIFLAVVKMKGKS